MTKWNKAKKYLVFYAKDDKCIKRRDIRNQLKDAVEAGDKLQKHNAFLLNEIDNYSESLNNAYVKLEAIRVLCNDPECRYPDDWAGQIKKIVKVLG